MSSSAKKSAGKDHLFNVLATAAKAQKRPDRSEPKAEPQKKESEELPPAEIAQAPKRAAAGKTRSHKVETPQPVEKPEAPRPRRIEALEARPPEVKEPQPRVGEARVGEARVEGPGEEPGEEPKAESQQRKPGKRKDPGYLQAGFWLTKETSADLDIEIGLAKRRGEHLGDRSDVVEMLLRRWIDSRNR